MNSDAHDCCCSSGRMREGRHDFMARVGDEIVVIKDVPALICDTCGEVEYTLKEPTASFFRAPARNPRSENLSAA